MNTKPTVIVVDDFLPDPDAVRTHALQQKFFESEYHKGKRTHERFHTDEQRVAFEALLGLKIPAWDKHGMNGVFQICTPPDPLVYHSDFQQYAATIYLTPNAPPDTGLSLYRSKRFKTRVIPPGVSEFDFYGGFYDPTLWELVDKIGNVYNRLVIFDARLVHAASAYFGTELTNGRLFQMFFFDAE